MNNRGHVLALLVGCLTTTGAHAAPTVAAGGSATFLLGSSGTAKGWGYNYKLQLGLGGTGNYPSASSVTAVTSGITQIAAGQYFTCALITGGSVKCWGYNQYGQYGNGALSSAGNKTATTTGYASVTQLAAGNLHLCGLLADGTVKCSGYNKLKQLSYNCSSDYCSSPVQVLAGVSGPLSGVKAIASSSQADHTCALLSTGEVKCWGSAASGQCGASMSNGVPSLVSGITNATAISVGADFSCALLADQTVKCWGSNASKQLGSASASSGETPVNVLEADGTNLTGVVSLTSGGGHSCAIKSDGQLRCWGKGDAGQLGAQKKANSASPIDPWSPGTPAFAPTSVAAGASHTCASSSTGQTYCWGSNTYGQLGSGSYVEALSPGVVPSTP